MLECLLASLSILRTRIFQFRKKHPNIFGSLKRKIILKEKVKFFSFFSLGKHFTPNYLDLEISLAEQLFHYYISPR